MKRIIGLAVVAAAIFSAQMVRAQAPAGSTGQCKDGTYSTAGSKKGACRGHQGVKEWYAPEPAASTPTPAAAAAKPSPSPAPAATAPAPAPAPPAATSKNSSPAAKAAARSQASGGGPGLVWVNTASNVYHCYGSDYYGKTKAGSYMSESDAKAKGAHPDHGKACSQ